MRNPWAIHFYSWKWNHDDSDWTDELVAQIPFDFDPRAQDADETGLFIAPIEAFQNNEDVGYCFDAIYVGHVRDEFKQTWYDVIDADESEYTFHYEASTNTHPVYFMAETYYYEIVPPECTTRRVYEAPRVEMIVQGRTEQSVKYED